MLLLVQASACTSERNDTTQSQAQAHRARVDAPLTVLVSRAPNHLDPRFVADPVGLKISRLVFASLVTVDPNTLEVVNDLAKSVAMTNDVTYRVVLRDGLTFSDGTPLTIDDVIATFQGVADPELGSRYRASFARVASYKRVDDHTVDIVLKAAHAPFLTDLEFPILPQRLANTRVHHDEIQQLVGAGPYVIAGMSSTEVRLVPNQRWHRAAPNDPLQPLRFLVIRDDNVRALHLQSGEADLAQNEVPALLLPLFSNSDEFETKSRPGLGTVYLGFNLTRAPMSNLRFREAVAHAIDRQALIKAKYAGRAELAESWIPSNHWASASLPHRSFDPTEARRLLQEAGLNSVLNNMRVVLRTPSDRSRLSIARAISAMLGEVGIEVRVMPSETASMIAELNRGAFDMVLLEMPELIEPHVLSWFFHSKRTPTSKLQGANRWRYNNPAVDLLLNQGVLLTSQASRRDVYVKVQEHLAHDLPVIPLWQPHHVSITRLPFHYALPRDGRFATLATRANSTERVIASCCEPS